MTAEKKISIIVADDDEDDREVFEMATKELKMPVNIVPAQDGKELLEYLNNNKTPDILFLDLNMPLMKGTECLEIIRADDRFKNLPIIILSTSSSSRDIDKCYELGANYYIVKPFSYLELSVVIKKLISKEWKEDFIYPPRNKFLVSGKS